MTTALIVDDQQENLYFLNALLKGNGMSVLVAHDGQEALDLARQTPPDLIVSDILMPRMDGFAFCRECKRDEGLRNTPFVFYTATYTDPRDEKLALNMGADRFLVKPMEPDAMIEELHTVLDSRSQQPKDISDSGAPEDEVVMREYNQALVRKLEEKLTELEDAAKEREERERLLDHLNRVLQAIRSVNQLIARQGCPSRLLEEACQALASTAGFNAVWIVAQGEDDAIIAAQRGFDEAAFDQLLDQVRDNSWPACLPDLKDCSRFLTGPERPSTCRTCPIADAYPGSELVVVPLVHEDHFHGVLGVSLDVEFAHTEAETSLLEEVGGDLAFALHAIRSDRARRESEATLAAIFDNFRDGIVMADPDTGRLLRTNPAALEMLGYSEEEVKHLSIDDIHPIDSLPHVHDQFEKQVRGELLVARDMPVLRKDGSVFMADINAAPFTSHGRTYILGAFRDITERQRAEEEREHLQAQLNQAQKMESIGRLAGGVSHDFNNMLSVILGYTELALEHIPEDHPSAEGLREIERAAQHSADLTRKLLAFAREQPLKPQATNLNRAVNSTLRMLSRLIGEDIELVWEPGSELWPVRLDPSQVGQILANLCVNAQDAIAGVGEIRIETRNETLDATALAAHPELAPGDYVLLAFGDTGCGMDKQTASRIFEPFFTTKGIGRGTGLGLSTVYGIVTQNGGFIDVYSEPGQGTTFNIFLSRESSESTTMDNERPTESPAAGGEKILVVEDQAALLKMATVMLQRQGYEVLSADCPARALEIARADGADIQLLMTDVILPSMGGGELATEVKKLCPQAGILFMSGYMPNSPALRGVLDKGANFISKPFSMSELREKVSEALANR
jgi:PAS domain S-box-containing protein